MHREENIGADMSVSWSSDADRVGVSGDFNVFGG